MDKKISKENLRLYAITDRSWLKDEESLASAVEAAIKGGATIVQLREKHLQGDELEALAVSVQLVCKKYKVPFIINDDVELAGKIKADGVHLGASDMEIKAAKALLGDDFIIGATAKTIDQAKNAQEAGADYLGSGAIFGTTTKLDAKPMSMELLNSICDSVSIPVVAIGGIDETNIEKLKDAHIAGAAVVSGIFARDNKEYAARKLLRLLGGKKVCTALTIAGSDSSGGAGIQADIKTMMANGVYAMSAITALTAQNTTGVKSIMEASPEFLRDQLECVFTDIRPDAVKTGMVSNPELIKVIVDCLKKYKARNIVVDPVMVATSGAKLSADAAISMMTEELFPIAKVITPNVPEAEILSAMKIENRDHMEQAAQIIYEKYGCAVLLKGGHSVSDADDLLVSDQGINWFRGQRIDNPNTHGTGCTLSSAIASNLAKGYSLSEAIEAAKEYISGALKDMLDLGQGSGPLNHGYMI